MRVQSRIRIPLRVTGSYVPSGRAVSSVEIPYIEFLLMHGPERSEYFYDCTACRGSGGSLFAADAAEIPEEIVEEMKIHAELCEGVQRVPSTELGSVMTSRNSLASRTPNS